MADRLDISLVVPAHNEAATIAGSLEAWLAAFARAGLRAELVVVDDGSVDATPALLASLVERHAELRVIRQAQSGHGAAVEAAYRASRADWVLQIDGDDEIGPTYFDALWALRRTDGMVLGRRAPSTRAAVRRLITVCAAGYVRTVSGAAVHDANVPYRLVPRPLLASFLAALPAGTFAPNLAMSIFAGHHGWRIAELPVVERPRVATRQSLGGSRLWRAVFRTLRQSAAFARGIRRQSPRA